MKYLFINLSCANLTVYKTVINSTVIDTHTHSISVKVINKDVIKQFQWEWVFSKRGLCIWNYQIKTVRFVIHNNKVKLASGNKNLQFSGTVTNSVAAGCITQTG